MTNIITLTTKAQNQILNLILKETKDPEQNGLRIAIKGGGCSGLSYDLKFDQSQESDFVQEYDLDSKPVKIFIDPKSAIYLKGMEVDFDDSLTGKGFTFRNPNASDTCGCGESFSVF